MPCIHCGVKQDISGISKVNPDFSTFDGMGLILQKGPEQRDENGHRWWVKFLDVLWSTAGVFCNSTIPLRYLQDPDRLANELYTFLKEGR